MLRVCLLVVGLLACTPSQAEDSSRATMWQPNGVVTFWQTNLIGSHGVCVVKFMFDAAALKQPVTDFVLTVRVIGPQKEDLGVGRFEVIGWLDPTVTAARYNEAMFEGIQNWEYPGKEEGNPSPLCWPGISLNVESAVGKQAGRQVDLVQSKQLVFKEFQKVNVKVGK